MKKKIKEWFESESDQVLREKLLANYDPEYWSDISSTDEVSCMSEALLNGFVWSLTKEGSDYWSMVQKYYTMRELFLKVQEANEVMDGVKLHITTCHESEPHLYRQEMFDTEEDLVKYLENMPYGEYVVSSFKGKRFSLSKVTKWEVVKTYTLH